MQGSASLLELLTGDAGEVSGCQVEHVSEAHIDQSGLQVHLIVQSEPAKNENRLSFQEATAHRAL